MLVKTSKKERRYVALPPAPGAFRKAWIKMRERETLLDGKSLNDWRMSAIYAQGKEARGRAVDEISKAGRRENGAAALRMMRALQSIASGSSYSDTRMHAEKALESFEGKM